MRPQYLISRDLPSFITLPNDVMLYVNYKKRGFRMISEAFFIIDLLFLGYNESISIKNEGKIISI
ncbi:hypothetical protein J43TS9_12730 [Paenibacillus cineris]|nr:hypothetical protein J43TS9_12730 [Paenibacillus cineris]